MADPTPDDLARIDQNQALARGFLSAKVTQYAALRELLGGGDLAAQHALMDVLRVEQPDTLVKLLVLAIADRHAEGMRLAEFARLAELWTSRADTIASMPPTAEDQLRWENAGRLIAYRLCADALRELLGGA
jgi:hypothetical protein